MPKETMTSIIQPSINIRLKLEGEVQQCGGMTQPFPVKRENVLPCETPVMREGFGESDHTWRTKPVSLRGGERGRGCACSASQWDHCSHSNGK